MSKLSHKQVRKLIQQNQISINDQRDLANHLDHCSACQEYAKVHMHLSHNIYLEGVRTKPSPKFKSDILNRVNREQRRKLIMNPIKTFAAVATILAVVIFAWFILRSTPVDSVALQSQDVSIEAPTRTPRPTLTPLPTRVQDILRQVTLTEELVGVWGYQRGPGFNLYYQFGDDGTFRIASTASRERLENSPSVIGKFWFDDSRLLFKIEQNTLETATCIDNIGVYEVHLLETGDLRFKVIEDDCTWRARQFSDHDAMPVEIKE